MQSVDQLNKALSIVIPSYNMEAYLNRCLDSLVLNDKELMEKLDVIVVNDGSKDKTSEIAHSYASRYPNSIRVIDKPNGHYGSCVNAALPVATGKYFRILDADDWFDKAELSKLIVYLENTDTDCIHTNFVIHAKEITIVKPENVLYNNIYAIDESLSIIKSGVMHTLTYKLDFLRKISYRQTEGICYTDTEYVYYPLIRAKTITYLNLNLYQYFIGREDQSMSESSMVKNRHHLFRVLKNILESPNSTDLTCYRLIIDKTIGNNLPILLNLYLYYHKPSKVERLKLVYLLGKVKDKCPEIFVKTININYHHIPIYRLWYKFGNIYYPIFRLISRF